ncbi:MAG: alpha/beta hydrolase [Candidatus Rokubacteria bacterium]|nr:alpha/beta hydrolase [Candidatus Rokubacteria bacterium]
MPDGAAIAYRLWRPGAPRRLLVLLHGVGSNMTRWTEFVGRTSLRNSWDLLRLDLRGHGLSLHRGRIGMAEWCADLAGVLTAEGYGRAVIAGHCLGAGIATEFAVRRPERTAGLVLIEPVFRPALTGGMRRLAQVRPLFIAVAGLARALNALGLHRRRLATLDLEVLDRETRDLMVQRGSAEALARYASPLLDLRTTATAVYLQALIALTGPIPDLQVIRASALALVTPGGSFTDPAVTRRLLERLGDCRVISLAARHWIPTEQPEAMREAIEGWCLAL